MHISPLTFGRLLSIVEAFPELSFAGSNADLPIVGGFNSYTNTIKVVATPSQWEVAGRH